MTNVHQYIKLRVVASSSNQWHTYISIYSSELSLHLAINDIRTSVYIAQSCRFIIRTQVKFAMCWSKLTQHMITMSICIPRWLWRFYNMGIYGICSLTTLYRLGKSLTVVHYDQCQSMVICLLMNPDIKLE